MLQADALIARNCLLITARYENVHPLPEALLNISCSEMKAIVYASWGRSAASTWEDVHYLTSYLARNG